MASVNRWIGIGNLGRDAELRYTGNGSAVASFSIACNETWKDRDGQKQERVEWIPVSLWGKPAEAVAQYLTKGKQVYVEGRIQTRKYTGRDGQEKKAWEVRADRVQLLGGGGSSSGGASRRTREPEYDGDGEDNRHEESAARGFDDGDDDVPF